MAINSVLAKMAVMISANTVGFNTAMKQSQAQMTAFQKSSQRLNSTLQGFGAAFGLMEVARGIGYAIDTIGDFSHAMQEVRAITQATDKDFAALRDNALELGRTTKFTAKEVAELQIAFGRLGFSTREILNATEATLELAAATGEDLAKSADIAGSTLRAFNLDASEMQRVVDVMAASFNKSALGLDNFGESMKYVAPVAAAANISLEETTAMLGVLADAGIRGSMAGTSLRKIISDVKNESGTLAERLQKLADKGLTGAEAMDEVGRTAYASLLILTKHVNKVNEASEAYRHSAGEAKKMARLMEDDLWGDIKLLDSAMDGFILKFSEGEGSLREFTQALTDLITFLSEDEVVDFLKDWAELILLIPLATKTAIQEIAALNDESEKMLSDAAKFDKMMADRRAKWLNMTMPNVSATWNPFGGMLNDDGSISQKTNDVKDQIKDTVADISAEWNRQFSIWGKEENPWSKVLDINDATSDFLPKVKNQLAGLNSVLQINSNAWAEWQAGVSARTQLAAEAMEAHQEKTMQMAEVAQTLGGAFGDMFEAIASGQQDLAQAMLKVTEQIITMYLRQSIAAMIASHMRDPKTAAFPFAKIALAAAGIGAVKALFGQVGGNTGGVGGGVMSAPGRTPSEVGTRITGRFRGYDLAVVADNERYRRGRMG